MIKAARQKKRRKRRLYFAGLLVVLLAAAGAGFYRLSLSLQDISRIIQLAAGRISDNHATVRASEPVLRGTIYDCNFKELAVSYRLFSLYVHPAELSDRLEVAEKLAGILGMERDLLAEKLKNVQRVIAVSDDLDEQQAADVEALALDGVYCKPLEKRYYPAHAVAGYLLGFTSNSVGLAGVEGLYDSVLQPGEFRNTDVAEVDFVDSEALGRTTTDVILTVDTGLQKLLEQQLHDYRVQKGAARGVALALEPGTGRMLALVSQPGIDPNYFWQADDGKMQNLAFRADFNRDLIRPLLVKAAAIYDFGMEGKILPATVRAPDYGLSAETIDKYWQLFGMQQPVHNFFPVNGSEPKAGCAEKTAALNSLSGMQLEVGLASLINGGNRLTPFFLSGIYDHDQDRFYRRDEEAVQRQRIIPPAAGIHLRRALMHQSPYSGKKGFLFVNTKRTIALNRGLTDYRIQEVLCAAVPREMPKVLLVMVVDYGTLYPLPVRTALGKKKTVDLASVGHRLLSVLGGYGAHEMTAEHPGEKNEENYRRFLISTRLELPELKRRSAHIATRMPEVTGLSLRKALQHLSPYHLSVKIKGSGHIIGQNPAAGEPLSGVDVCQLILNSGI